MTNFGEGKIRKGTRKGVKANHPGEKLVNVTDGKDIKRISRKIAAMLVTNGGWRYCAKRFKLEVS